MSNVCIPSPGRRTCMRWNRVQRLYHDGYYVVCFDRQYKSLFFSIYQSGIITNWTIIALFIDWGYCTYECQKYVRKELLFIALWFWRWATTACLGFGKLIPVLNTASLSETFPRRTLWPFAFLCHSQFWDIVRMTLERIFGAWQLLGCSSLFDSAGCSAFATSWAVNEGNT